MIQIEKNKQALDKFKETYPDVQWIFEQDPTTAINYLRLLGFRCASCGGLLTSGNVEFFNYSKDTLCFTCQNENKSPKQ